MPPSNDALLAEIARACGEAAGAASSARALSAVLRSAAAALGAERAYLVTSEAAAPRTAPAVRASISLREDGIEGPSSTALRRALRETRPTIRLDLGADPALGSGDSIRSMALRWVVAAPVPARSRPAALVLDSRRLPPSPDSGAEAVLEAYAAIAGLVLSSVLDGRADAGEGEEAPDVSLIGRSAAFRALLGSIPRVAATRLPVLIVGESGAGKEAIARSIHAASPRSAGPLVAINCAAIAESLLESELFGATRGAYTGADRDRPGVFALAHGGTLLLDEVGDMPLAMQGKVLRAIQEGRVRPVGGAAERSVDVRVVAATHRDLAALTASGGFRSDLYYRLAVVELRVPPLRERREDIPALVEHLLRMLEREHGLAPARPTEEALAHLVAHDWPGNVRELHAVLARALLRSHSGTIARRDLDLRPAPRPAANADTAVEDEPRPLEERMLRAALRETGGNVTRAARIVGWSRAKMSRRLRALGIEQPV
jgi:two-component system response regulator PilR (NtrC family)